jgi:hypothetical protein
VDGFVQVATDGAGKRMRNALRYVLQADGTMQPVYEELIQLVGPNGDPVNFDLAFDDLRDEIQKLTRIIATVNGFDDEEFDADPHVTVPRVLAGGGLPATKAAPWNPVKNLGDSFGRQVVLPVAMRDMVLTQGTTISASTGETTILTAAPGVFLDLVLLLISNTSAATSTRVDIRDKTAGTVLFSLQSVGGANPVGFALPIPIPQTTENQNWTAQCATSTTDVRIYAVAVKNK